MTHVNFRADVKIAARIVSYRNLFIFTGNIPMLNSAAAENISQGDCALRTSDVIIMTPLSQKFLCEYRNKFTTKSTVYLGFLIVYKLTKIHRFVTYLSNDPRISFQRCRRRVEEVHFHAHCAMSCDCTV